MLKWMKRQLDRLAAWWLFSHYDHTPTHDAVMDVLEKSCPRGETYALHGIQEDALVKFLRYQIQQVREHKALWNSTYGQSSYYTKTGRVRAGNYAAQSANSQELTPEQVEKIFGPIDRAFDMVDVAFDEINRMIEEQAQEKAQQQQQKEDNDDT